MLCCETAIVGTMVWILVRVPILTADLNHKFCACNNTYQLLGIVSKFVMQCSSSK